MSNRDGVWRRRVWADLPIRWKGLAVVAVPLLTTIVLAIGLTATGRVTGRENDIAAVGTKTIVTLGHLEKAVGQLRESVLAQAGGAVEARNDERTANLAAQSDLYRLAGLTVGDVEDSPRVASMRTALVRLADSARRMHDVEPGNEQALYREAVQVASGMESEIHTWQSAEQQELEVGIAHVDSLSRTVQRLGWLALFTGLLAGLFAMTGFVRGIGRRVERLEANARRLAVGEPLEDQPDSRDELGRLAATLDASAGVLAEREEDLRSARRELERVVAASPAAIFSFDPDSGRTLYQSRDHLGHPAGSFLDEGFWASLVHPDDAPRVFGRMPELLTSGTGSMEYRMRHADGTYHWMLTDLVVLRNEDGEAVEVVGAGMDIDQHVRDRESLRSREAALSEAERVAHIGNWEWRIDQDVVEVSPELRRIMDIDLDASLTYARLVKRVHPDDLPALSAATARCRDTGRPTALTHRIVRRDGEIRHLQGGLVALRDDHGNVQRLVGTSADVTERIQMEESLTRTTARYRSLFEQASAGIYLGTLDGHALQVNQAFASLLGYPSDASFIAEVRDTVTVWAEPAKRALFVQAMKAAGEVSALETQWRRRDGRLTWVLLSARMVQEADGTQVVVGVVVDIDTRKRAEESSRVNADRFQALFEGALDGVLLGGYDNRFVDANLAACKVLGYTREALLGKGLDDILSPNIRADAAAMWERFVLEGHATAEYPVQTGDGRQIVVEFTSKQTLLPGLHLSIVRDVTQERSQHARVAQSEGQLAEAQQIAHVGSWEWTAAKPVLHWSDQLFRIAGYEPNAFEPSFEFVLEQTMPEDRPHVAASVDQAMLGGDAVRYMQRILRPDGEVRHLDCNLRVTLGPDGSIEQMLGSAADVTERVDAEAALREAFEREQQASGQLRANGEMRDAFLTAVSHELRTPLTSVLGFALTLERSEDLNDGERRHLVTRLAANARRLERLLGDLLDLDRIRRGVDHMRLTAVDMKTLAARVVVSADYLGTRIVAVEGPHVTVPVDGPKVERIVDNLLSNAAKYSPSDGRISIRVRERPDGVELVVENEGETIPDALKEGLFEPFVQGPNRVPHSPGVGIGLSLVRSFATMHGGRAWVEDRPGGGASFRVFLPAVPGAPPPVAPVDRVLVG